MMNTMTCGEGLKLLCPDGFHIMDDEEQKQLNFYNDSPGQCLSDPERHILISVGYKNGYIAKHSRHSRGSTVDLTLFDETEGKEVDMGGTFDYFGEISHVNYPGLTQQQYANRVLLRNTMVSHGFIPLEEEWWHFTLANEPYPDTYFTFPVSRASLL